MASSRKIERRQIKYKNILKNEYNINASAEPTKFLMICNGGLVNNCQREDILKLFQTCCAVEKINMPEKKSFCFISLRKIEDASNCYTMINGQKSLPGMNGPLYLIFTESMPEDKVEIDFGHPSGLMLLDNFVTEEEEKMLLNCINFGENNSSEMKNRLVKHYGYEFLYSSNNVDPKCPLEDKIPGECSFIFTRLKELGYNLPLLPDQLTVNKYWPGHGIPSHVDIHSAFEDPIMSLSLGSSIVMEFKRDGQHKFVDLPNRSLLIMSGESRYAWKHGIVPRKFDILQTNTGLNSRERGVRTSLTFRKIRCYPCNCSYVSCCDSQAVPDVPSKISDEIASSLEKKYVHSIYSEISHHFSQTRHKAWPNVLKFIESLRIGSVLIDVGCGNGKYFGFNKGIFEIGVDQCEDLVKICSDRGYNSIVGNCLSLPFCDNIAEAVISIAVIHHLSTPDRRLKAVEEMVRILKPNGRALIYVWAKNQVNNCEKSSYLKQSRPNRNTKNDSSAISLCDGNFEITADNMKLSLPVHKNRTDFQHQDVLVPWKLKYKTTSDNVPTFLRYYHVFEENEIEKVCSLITNVQIVNSYYDQGNWCVILEKLAV